MVAIKLYDIETGHVQTLAEVASAERARAWLDRFAASGIGTSDVSYTTEVVARPRVRVRGATLSCGCAQEVTQLARSG